MLSSTSTLETTDLAITSDSIDQTSLTTSFDESTSPEITSSPDDTSTTSTPLLTTIDDQFTSILPTTVADFSSSPYEISSESATTMITTLIDSITSIEPDESSTFLLMTTHDDETFASTDSSTFETIPISSTLSSSITDEQSEEYTSTQSSLEIESTTITLPDVYNPTTEHSTLVVTHSSSRSIPSTRRKTRKSTTTTSTTTTTTKSYKTRKQKITLSTSQPSVTTTSTTLVQTTSIYTTTFLTSFPTSIVHSTLSSLQPQQQPLTVTKPTHSPNPLLPNELFNSLFNSPSNSSGEKLIQLNLANLPPSSWEVSFQTNESLLLDIVLPPASYPSNADTITNLTIANVEANRFSANIVGSSVNLQVDQIQTKQFSLAMNLTNNQTTPSSSDVVIGHIKSEQFQLDITKSDNMNLHVQQVDSDTAELFFNSEFCTNESNLQINLNLSKNGKENIGFIFLGFKRCFICDKYEF